MQNFVITNSRLKNGIWSATIASDKEETPEIGVRYMGRELDNVEIYGHAPVWHVSMPVPTETISDGVHTFVVKDKNLDVVIGRFGLMAGDVLAEDFVSELALLRDELDMLKKAFRRHCSETGQN